MNYCTFTLFKYDINVITVHLKFYFLYIVYLVYNDTNTHCNERHATY